MCYMLVLCVQARARTHARTQTRARCSGVHHTARSHIFSGKGESCLRSLAKESLSKDIYPSSLLNWVQSDVGLILPTYV